MYPREPGASLQKWAHTQVTVGARVACYHDEIKLSLPATWTPTHHLLFTFFHVDLQTKLEAPKPVSSTFAFVSLKDLLIFPEILFVSSSSCPILFISGLFLSTPLNDYSIHSLAR